MPNGGSLTLSLFQITHSLARGTANVIGNLFGDTKPSFGGRRRSGETDNVDAVVPRTLLPWSVIPNSATNTVSLRAELTTWCSKLNMLLT
jgi:hypothetical protein